jgi:hypothetical protein
VNPPQKPVASRSLMFSEPAPFLDAQAITMPRINEPMIFTVNVPYGNNALSFELYVDRSGCGVPRDASKKSANSNQEQTVDLHDNFIVKMNSLYFFDRLSSITGFISV